jgi:hypothetical protein
MCMFCAKSVGSQSKSDSQSENDSFESILNVMEGAGLHLNVDHGNGSKTGSVGSVDQVLLRQVLTAELSKPLTKMEMVSCSCPSTLSLFFRWVFFRAVLYVG